jgi:amino acid transporter
MNDLKQQPWWKRSVTVTPAAATLIGIAVGSALGGLVAFPWLDRVSLIMGLFLALLGGVSGYILWLTNDRARGERFRRTASWVGLVAVAVLLLAFPDFWWRTWRANGSSSIYLFGAICAASMFVVGTGWGLIHLVGYLTARLRSDTKASPAPSSGGVWDRELD